MMLVLDQEIIKKNMGSPMVLDFILWLKHIDLLNIKYRIEYQIVYNK